MRILFLTPKKLFDTKMSRVRFQQVAAIGKHLREGGEGRDLFMSGPGWTGWDDTRTTGENIARFGEHCDLVLTYGVQTPDSPRPVAVQYNEADDHAKVERFVYENHVRLVVFHHANDQPHYQRQFEARGIMTTHIPHCVDTDVFKDYGLPKDIDVLVAGNLSSHFYPFRYRLMTLAHRVLRKRGYKVVILPHPGYSLPPREGTVVGEDFARVLNRSKIVLTCSMRFNYALAKYSEIAACRALPCGDLPGERHDFFKRTILNVEPFMTDDLILRTIEDTLDDDETLTRLTTQAHDLTRMTSTMGVYADKFVEAVRMLFKEWL